MRSWVILLPILPYSYQEDLNGESAEVAENDNEFYLGCYIDEDDPNRLYPMMRQTDEASPEHCARLCRGYNFAYMGLEAGDWCLCGQNEPPAASKTADTECNRPCKGDQNRTCGGSWRASIYQIGSFGVNSDDVEKLTENISVEHFKKERFNFGPLMLGEKDFTKVLFKHNWYDTIGHDAGFVDSYDITIDVFGTISATGFSAIHIHAVPISFNITLGTYEKTIENTMYYTQGSECWNGSELVERKTSVFWSCGAQTGVLLIDEPESCSFRILMSKRCPKDPVEWVPLNLDQENPALQYSFISSWYDERESETYEITISMFGRIFQIKDGENISWGNYTKTEDNIMYHTEEKIKNNYSP